MSDGESFARGAPSAESEQIMSTLTTRHREIAVAIVRREWTDGFVGVHCELRMRRVGGMGGERSLTIRSNEISWVVQTLRAANHEIGNQIRDAVEAREGRESQ